jgi:predicted nucleic acid-binding protein
MIKTYIDCNILLDWLLDREPFSSYSAKIIELTETKKIIGIVSPLTLANTYWTKPLRGRHSRISLELQLVSLYPGMQSGRRTFDDPGN